MWYVYTGIRDKYTIRRRGICIQVYETSIRFVDVVFVYGYTRRSRGTCIRVCIREVVVVRVYGYGRLICGACIRVHFSECFKRDVIKILKIEQ